jgi:hypothetical protein
MFLLGKQSCDSLGGESRDLEPFGGLEPIWTENRPRVSHEVGRSVRTDNSQPCSVLGAAGEPWKTLIKDTAMQIS